MEFIKRLFGLTPKVDLHVLRESLEPKLAAIKKPAVRLVTNEHESRTKFGGRPFVESHSFVWPKSKGKPMAFLAQLDLAEIAKVHRYEWLSTKGLLLFFYDLEEMPWGFDPKDRGKWQVLYQENPNEYANYPDGFENEFKIKEKFAIPTLVEVLPGSDNPVIETLNLSKEEIDLYIELASTHEAPLHQVGGLPSPVQGDYMELESQLASNGIYVGSPDGYESAEAKNLHSGAADWKLLLQFDSDDDLEVMWGDCGMIYFWVQEQKSKINQFDNCWLILQCC